MPTATFVLYGIKVILRASLFCSGIHRNETVTVTQGKAKVQSLPFLKIVKNISIQMDYSCVFQLNEAFISLSSSVLSTNDFLVSYFMILYGKCCEMYTALLRIKLSILPLYLN